MQAEIEALLTKAGMVDAEEDERWGEDFRGDELPEELQRREKRLAAIQASDHDASVPRLPEAAHVLAQDRDGDAGLAARLSNMARRDLPGGDEPQGGFVDEAPPRPGHRPEVRVVSRTPHSRGVEGGRRSAMPT